MVVGIGIKVVVIVAAVKLIGAGAAGDRVVSAVAAKQVVATVADDCVAEGGAEDLFNCRVVRELEFQIAVVDGVVRAALREVDRDALGKTVEVERIEVGIGDFDDRIGAEIAAVEEIDVVPGTAFERVVAASSRDSSSEPPPLKLLARALPMNVSA